MGIKKLVIVLLILAFAKDLLAQDNTERLRKLEALREGLRADSAHIFRYTPWKAYLKVENRRTFVNKESISLIGGMAGGIYRERHIFCGGYYFLNPGEDYSVRVLEDQVFTRQFLRQMEYFNFSYQYILFNRRYFQVNLPLELGYGRFHLDVEDAQLVRIRQIDGDIVPVGAGAQLILKPVRWAGFSFLGGYRYIREDQERQLKLNFKGWFYTIGVWVDARHLYRMGRYYQKKRRYRQNVRNLG